MTAAARPSEIAKIATDLLKPPASIPTSSAPTVETLKKVSPADNHFMSLGPG
jgi:hypothetical protein